MRPMLAAGLTLAVLAAAPPARAEAPVASFTVDPAVPRSGDTVTFTSTAAGTIDGQSWDLDGDGRCNDATGPASARAFPAPATYLVGLCVTGPDGDASQVRRITVADLAPAASFEVTPAAPRAGQQVTFISTATDQDSAMSSFDWDLDGDGAFDDAQGIAVPWTFAAEQTVV